MEKNITGKTFGRLKAIRPTGKRKNGTAVWLCECECGESKEVVANSLISGNTRSCGCLGAGRKPIDLAGKTFGRLKAIQPTGDKRNGHIVWLCECECGGRKGVAQDMLQRGLTKSCGCLRRGRKPSPRY
ncbi:MAG: hypothetical protein FWH32_01715 [Clostridiales bacterium]|nr:hypothetical protein [Clostridiales bacterium]